LPYSKKESLRRHESSRIRLIEFKPKYHEIQHSIPVFKANVPGQGTDIIEKGLPGGQIFPDQFVFFIQNIQGCMKKEGQEIERKQKGGQVLFPMAEVMFEVISFCFQGIIVFVLNFPSCSTSLYNLLYIFWGDIVISGKGVFINKFAIFQGGHQFTPVDE